MRGLLLSLRFRITAVVVGLFAVSLSAGSWFLLRRFEVSLIADIKTTDIAELEGLAETYNDNNASFTSSYFQSGDVWILPPGPDGTLYQVWDEFSTVIAYTPVYRAFDNGSATRGDLVGIRDVPAPDGLEFVTSVIVAPALDSTITLMAWTSLDQVNSSMRSIETLMWIVVPTLVAAAGAAAWVVSGRTLKPVAAIASQAERISDTNLHERVPVPKTKGEIHSLATTMNDMLGRLESSQNRLRELVSDASHELRNPVATSIARLETALAHPADVPWGKTAEAVLVEQQRLGTLVDELLTLARLDEQNLMVTSDVDVDDLLLDEAARIESVEVDTSEVRPSRMTGDRALLQRAFRNLIENASRYASTKIWISSSKKDDTVKITIEDDGPGIKKADREKVFQRFYRPDTSRAREHGGAGLGLAIVHAIVTRSGGTIGVSTSRHGGAKFCITLS